MLQLISRCIGCLSRSELSVPIAILNVYFHYFCASEHFFVYLMSYHHARQSDLSLIKKLWHFDFLVIFRPLFNYV